MRIGEVLDVEDTVVSIIGEWVFSFKFAKTVLRFSQVVLCGVVAQSPTAIAQLCLRPALAAVQEADDHTGYVIGKLSAKRPPSSHVRVLEVDLNLNGGGNNGFVEERVPRPSPTGWASTTPVLSQKGGRLRSKLRNMRRNQSKP